MKGVHTLVLSGNHMTTGLSFCSTELIIIYVLLRCRDPWASETCSKDGCQRENKRLFPEAFSADEWFSADDTQCLSSPGDRPSISKSNCQNNPKFTSWEAVSWETSLDPLQAVNAFLVSTCMSINKLNLLYLTS